MTQVAAASEPLAVGKTFGLDRAVMLDAHNASTRRNHATEVKLAQFVLSRSFDSGFALRLIKDLRTALGLADNTATPVPLSAGCLKQWTAVARLGPTADHTRIVAYVHARARVEAQLTGPFIRHTGAEPIPRTRADR